jgi:hypothetical protein
MTNEGSSAVDEDIQIGRWYAGYEFEGEIDDVIIYDRPLSEAEKSGL